ncbi:hypothetical protein QFC21_005899 [Naganishia friedmannii]|uniref:Uncharacterized protein n=1 Tax=Naganishia friedmannii TaxID=89922 RepID=A0ACC2V7C6_9TREE|nr:hypothetical protein QFC21_005899 [Naganishia friedmannii]
MWISRFDPDSVSAIEDVVGTTNCFVPSGSSSTSTPETASYTGAESDQETTKEPLKAVTITGTETQQGTIATHMNNLLAESGGNTWPPTPTPAQAWPAALQPYHTIALLAPPHFVDSSALHPQRSDEDLRHRISESRQWLTIQLRAAVDLPSVLATLDGLDTGTRGGFLACLAYLAHLYRWGMIPVVRIAQDETTLPGLPEEVKVPLQVLHDVLGIETTGGCLYTMTLLNVHPTEGLIYSNLRHVADVYPTAATAERLNAEIFYEMERLALPFYHALSLLPSNIDNPRPHLQNALDSLRASFKKFAETVHERKLKKDVWMSHAQGFHGWGLDGYDGVSGDHSLLIRAVDAFLGIGVGGMVVVPPKKGDSRVPMGESVASLTPTTTGWLSWITRWWRAAPARTEPSPPPPPPPRQPTTITPIPYSPHYLPSAQNTFLAAIRTADLRSHPSISSAPELAEIVKLVKLWRLGHTRKAVYYEDLDLPERRPMTASGGVYGGVSAAAAAHEEHGEKDGAEKEGGEGGEVEQVEMIRRLEARLRARIEATR